MSANKHAFPPCFGLLAPTSFRKCASKSAAGLNTENHSNSLKSSFKYLKDIYQPEQRTDDWYVFRHNLITASSAWKGLDSSEKIVNSLIYEKCQPLNLTKYSNVNIYSPFVAIEKTTPL